MGAHTVGRVGDIPHDGQILVELEGRSIGVFHVNGGYFALQNSCAHQSGPVCEGGVFPAVRARVEPDGKVQEYFDYEQKVVACPWHGWEFDVATGHCLADPTRRLRSYRVEVVDDQIIVDV